MTTAITYKRLHFERSQKPNSQLFNVQTISARTTRLVGCGSDFCQNTETNKLISEMDQFKDLVADDLPATATRLGFEVNSAAEPETKLDAQAPPRLPSRNRTLN